MSEQLTEQLPYCGQCGGIMALESIVNPDNEQHYDRQTGAKLGDTFLYMWRCREDLSRHKWSFPSGKHDALYHNFQGVKLRIGGNGGK